MAKLLSNTRVYGTATVDTQLFVNGTNSAHSAATGALQISGGLGVAGGGFFGGSVTATNFVGAFSGTASSANDIAGGTAGQLLYQISPGDTGFVGPGTAGQFLRSNGTSAPSYISTSSIYVNSSVFAEDLRGGSAGQLVYQSAANTTAFVGPGTAGQVLTSNGASAPVYVTTTTLYVGNAVTSTNIRGGAANQFLYQSASGTTAFANTGSMYVGRAVVADSVTGGGSTVETVEQTANASYYLTFVDSNNSVATSESIYTTSTLIINPATGTLNIGTTTSLGKVTISDPGATTFTLERISNDTGPPEAIGRKARGVAGAKTGVLSGDRLWFFAAAGYVGTEGSGGAYSANRVGMNFVASETWSPTAQGSHITFATTEIGGTTRTDKVIITGAGDVGIGAGLTTPNYKLDVDGVIQGRQGLRTGLGYNSYISDRLQFAASTGITDHQFKQVDVGGSDSRLDLRRYTGTGDGFDSGEMVTFLSNGNVGIGTTSPYKKLEIAGDVQIDVTNANVWIKSGGAGTNGFINWTFNTDDTVYNKIGINYDTRGTTGFHIDAGYPITLDGTTNINFNLSGASQGRWNSTGLGVGTTSPSAKLHVQGTARVTSTSEFEARVYMGALAYERNPANAIQEWGGASSSFSLNIQDGTGRVNYYWNTNGTTSPTQTVANEDAYRFLLGTDNPILAFYGWEGSSSAAGTAITWTEVFRASMGEGNPYFKGTLIPIGSGTTNYVTKFTAAGTIGNSQIFDNGTNVGIGTTTPASLLNMHGSAPELIINNTSVSNAGVKIRYNGSTTHGLHLTYTPNDATAYIDNTYLVTGGTVYGDIYFRQNVAGTMTTRMTVKADGGNVGIGNTGPAFNLDVTGTARATSDFRAPIFYDTGNTNYFADPASTSNLSRLQLGNWSGSSGAGLSVQSVGTNSGPIVAKTTNYDTAWSILPWASGGTYISSGTYYNGGSWVHASSDTTNCLLWLKGNGPTWYSSNNSSGSWNVASNVALWNGAGRWTNDVTSPNDVRAPIFYDSNNTAYYTDPASTSILNVISNSRFQDGGGTFLFRPGTGSGTTRHINLADSTSDPSSVGSATGITAGQRSDNNAYYMIYVKSPYNNGYSTYSRLSLGWHTGVEIGGNPAYGGTRFMADSPGVNTNELMSVGKGDSHVRITNNLYVPIVYDSNNTGYYVDPHADRSTNINGFSARTVESTKGTYKYNIPRFVHTSDTNYWVGTMGWGQTDFNTVMTWGSGFFDTWSSPANSPGDTSHWVGVQAYHYVNAANSGYGWQLAGGVTDSLWWRHSWPSNSSWFKVAMYNNNVGTGAFYSTIMYDSNNTGYYFDGASTSSLNYAVIRNAISAEGNRFTNPQGGVYTTGASSVTGAIKIKLPANRLNSSTMVRFTVRLYEYSTGRSTTWEIGGYNYVLGNWYNIFATQLTDSGRGAFTVRFGQDGTSDCIWIGETGSTWSYPQVFITDVQTGYSGFSNNWGNDWAVSFVTSFDTVEQSRTASLILCSNNANASVPSLGVGTAASGTTGEIRATNEITAYYSDRRLKDNVVNLRDAYDKIKSLNGILYTPNDLAASFGYDKNKKLVGLFADEVEAVLPEAVRSAPFDTDKDGNSVSGENYKTIQYEKLVPLLIEAMKEQGNKIDKLQQELTELRDKYNSK